VRAPRGPRRSRADRDAGRPSVGGLAERLTQQLVEGDLRLLAERRGGDDVHVHVDLSRPLQLVAELAHRDLEIGVAEHDRLDREREVAELLDDPALALDRPLEQLGGLGGAAVADCSERGVLHERDARERLQRSVVKRDGQPPALVLLRRDQSRHEPLALRLAHISGRERKDDPPGLAANLPLPASSVAPIRRVRYWRSPRPWRARFAGDRAPPYLG
jgi:hypothetical protein